MKNIGITPKQIRKAIYGEIKADNPAIKKGKVIRRGAKPVRQSRPLEPRNPAQLFETTYTTTNASEFPVPEWFLRKDPAKVSLIVPLFNVKHPTFISSLGDCGRDVEVIFVEDACPIDSKSIVLKEWKRLKRPEQGRVYCFEAHQGFAACCNTGAFYATGETLIFLDPELQLGKHWLDSLLSSQADIVGSVLSYDNAPYEAGKVWSWSTEKFVPIPPHATKPPESVSWRLMKVQRPQFLERGGFCPFIQDADWAGGDFCLSEREVGKTIAIAEGASAHATVRKAEPLESCKHYFLNKWFVTGRMDSLVAERRKSPAAPINSVLIRRSAAYGDVLLAAAIAPALKRKYGCKISFLTDCPEVLEGNPWIDKILDRECSERQFRLFLDLDMAYEFRPNVQPLQAFANLAWVEEKNCRLFLKTELPRTTLPDHYVVIHAGQTDWAGRNWSSYKFNSIAARLMAESWPVVCIGTEKDNKVVCDYDLRGKTSVPQLSHIIKNARLFAGIDSFPFQIAQAFETPSVCFFGSVLPETRVTRKNVLPVVATELKCLGCHNRHPTPCVATNVCDAGIQDCVNQVGVEDFWQAIEHTLKSHLPTSRYSRNLTEVLDEKGQTQMQAASL